jgi:hypothetical protein
MKISQRNAKLLGLAQQRVDCASMQEACCLNVGCFSWCAAQWRLAPQYSRRPLAFGSPGAKRHRLWAWILGRVDTGALGGWLALAQRRAWPPFGVDALQVASKYNCWSSTKSTTAVILISAATFGFGHAYQGFRMVIFICLFGAMFGLLAYWCGTVRPGMTAHGWQDSLNGVLASLMKH